MSKSGVVRRPVPVLVVDDDDAVRDSLAALLRADGYDALVAADGAQALERLAALAGAGVLPAAIVMDLEMPRMNGWGLHATLKRDVRYSRIPIVVCSGTSDGTAPPAAAHLPKPIQPDRLLGVLEHFRHRQDTAA